MMAIPVANDTIWDHFINVWWNDNDDLSVADTVPDDDYQSMI